MSMPCGQRAAVDKTFSLLLLSRPLTFVLNSWSRGWGSQSWASQKLNYGREYSKNIPVCKENTVLILKLHKTVLFLFYCSYFISVVDSDLLKYA